MAATDACSAPVQEDGTTTTKSKTEVEPTNSETVMEAVTEAVTSPPEEAHPAGETKQSTEQPADGKAKQASENIFSSFLNKSGLGKVMGGKKKKEQSTEAVEANGEGNTEQKKASDQAEEPAANGTEAAAEDQAIEKAPENQVKVRSKSLDRLEDPEALNATVDQLEDAPAAEGSEKPASSATTKHIKRWHSFKKLMAQKSHKKSTEESKEAEGSEGASGGTPGDTSTLDSKASESSGQKRWKLKRSWTFQGLKRDPSVVGISKAAATGEKAEGEENATENDEAAAPETDEAKAQVDGKTQEKTNTDGEEEKGATAAPHKSMNQHADEIWTSFKKRVIPKSKRSADTVAASGEEEGAAASEPAEQTEEAGKEQAKSAKAKRTHFNRAVSLKNFIMRKGKSTSVDQGDGAPKEGKEAADGEAKDTEDAAAPAGTCDSQQAADGEAKDTEDAAGTSDSQQGEADAAQGESNDKGEAQVANEHTVADEEAKEPATSTPSGPEPEKANSAEPAAPAEPAAEVKTNGENGCSNGTPEEDATHNHETTLKKDGPTDEAKQENTNSSMDTKILNLGTGIAVAQSEKKAGNV
ncbi:A-kinase anchor protein 12-like [Salvelinus fontinalis]|uniref:A-kinase anchor protein 12-like n=1 Tax=Salvelinus fontinalis TaxID=8038 RepID=UPI002485E697|nr:A-kinase anchor protein 12-like [Salvelinus fontinalis]